MTNAQTSTLVFRDQAGEYYLLSQESLERGRVPAEHTAEVERLIAEQQDVQGYLGFIVHAVISIGTAIGVGIGALAQDRAQQTVHPTSLPGLGGIPTGHPETISTGGGPQRI